MKKFMLFAVSMLMILSMLLTACTPETEETPAVEPVEATTEPVEAVEEPVAATEEPVAATEEPVVATEEPVVEPAIADQVTVAIGADPADLSPFTGMSMGRIAVLKTIYEYLVETDRMGANAVPMIAQSVGADR